MTQTLIFSDRAQFRDWLTENCTSCDGVWLVLGKPNGPLTLKADEALEEALCFGWIDGQIQSVDEKRYRKYFSLRRNNSKWSAKNKALANRLERQGLMTEYGRAQIAKAKQNGQWDAPPPPSVTPDQIAAFDALLKTYEPAYTNFTAMPPSVKKTYALAYWDAKTEEGRKKRFSRIVDRLNDNLKPM